MAHSRKVVKYMSPRSWDRIGRAVEAVQGNDHLVVYDKLRDCLLGLVAFVGRLRWFMLRGEDGGPFRCFGWFTVRENAFDYLML